MRLLHGNCLEVLKQLNDNTIHSVITDPPYGLAFMNKRWDYDVPSVDVWREVLRVLRPGGHLLSFGGTRTYHRLVVNIENAGFEIRDQIQWIYGSGFPKSHNIKEGNFKGWGTALKPANEPICLARKPLEGTVADNIKKWGVGGLNIDGCRIGTDNVQCNKKGGGGTTFHGQTEKPRLSGSTCGRWPANLMFDEIAAKMLDKETQHLHALGNKIKGTATQKSSMFGIGEAGFGQSTDYGDSGGASRFFYVAKASKRERGTGNNHPTVKPIKLMKYLCKLITPPNGIVLDPFMGSGSTGLAAINLGFDFIGIEKELEYLEIATKRIENGQ